MSKKNSFDENDDLSGLARDVVRELKATTDLVVDAAKLGKDELLHYVSESIRQGLSAIDPVRPRETEKTREAEEKRARESVRESVRARREARTAPAKKPKKLRIRHISKSGPPYFLISGCFYFVTLVLLGIFLSNAYYGYAPVQVLPIAIGFALGGSVPLWLGWQKQKKEKLYERYRSVVGSTPRMGLDELAARSKRSYAETLKDVNDMVERGYFGPEATLDAVRGILIVNPYAPIREVMEEDEPRQTSQPEAEAEAETESRETSADGYEAMLLELRRVNERIEDEAMSSRIYRIEAVARATFLAVREKPEKRAQIQRFMDYYLPTTLKLLSAYADFEKQTVVGDNIRSSKANIERMMETLSEAYEKQFDSLFRAESMDINAEIRTMDSLLRQDGYVGGFTMPTGGGAARGAASGAAQVKSAGEKDAE